MSTSIAPATGVYNSSVTPSSLPWNTYNYCNAPHVNAAYYEPPSNASGVSLVYMNVMIRHHKRTPDNLYPLENELNSEAWDCTNFEQFVYGGGGAAVFHETVIPSTHPFLPLIWNGTCDEGQLTQEGFQDAVKHGQDFWSVYNEKLHFLTSVNDKDIWIRTSTEPRTQEVASAVLTGMDPSLVSKTWEVVTQPSPIDSIVPNYPCPHADDIRDAYQSVPAWNDHLDESAALQTHLTELTGTVGNTAWTSWYDHFFDTFSSRTCNGHPLPCNSSGACVSEADALQVFALGDFEYNYIWNTAQNASTYNSLTFGVMFSELADNFKSFAAGQEKFRLRFYVGHDGSMIRLASGLGLGKTTPLRWPAMGSEIVMEVWKYAKRGSFVRVIHEGTPVTGLEWVSLPDFIQLLEAQVPDDIFDVCNS